MRKKGESIFKINAKKNDVVLILTSGMLKYFSIEVITFVLNMVINNNYVRKSKSNVELA